MPSGLDSIVIDCADHRGLADFWRRVLDYQVLEHDWNSTMIAKDGSSRPRLLFLQTPDRKVVKNRLHIDLAPDDRNAEVERVIGLGARRIDIGQGERSWVVLADPEGNEFCVLRTGGS